MKRTLGIFTGAVLLIATLGYVYTAPYAGNQGLQRTAGVRIGGTDTPPPSDLSTVNDVGVNLLMKLGGFPPFVVYLSYVGTADGVITATRPDGGYWAQRVRDGGSEGWLRIGDETYAMRASEVLGDARLPMLELYSAKTGMPMDRGVGGPEPLRDWEVFFWTPR
jgi:hypothetical protein